MGATFNHEDYLAHHGIKGQKWGVRRFQNPDELMHFGILGMKWGIRRYQNKDGTLTELGKKRYGTKEGFEKHLKDEEEKRAAKAEAKKQKAINSGDPKKIKKYASDMTLQELQMANARAQQMANLDRYNSKGPKINPLDTAISVLDKAGKLGNTLASAAQAAKKVSDLLRDPEEVAAEEREKNFEKAKEKASMNRLIKEMGEAYKNAEGDEKEKARAAEEVYRKGYDAYKKASSGELQREYEARQKKKAKEERIKQLKKETEEYRDRYEDMMSKYRDEWKNDDAFKGVDKPGVNWDLFKNTESTRSKPLSSILGLPGPVDTSRPIRQPGYSSILGLPGSVESKPLSSILGLPGPVAPSGPSSSGKSSKSSAKSPNAIIAEALGRMSDIAENGKKVSDVTMREIDDYTSELLDKRRR